MPVMQYLYLQNNQLWYYMKWKFMQQRIEYKESVVYVLFANVPEN